MPRESTQVQGRGDEPLKADDRRAACRAPYREWAAVIFESDCERTIVMRCRDISATGLCLVGQLLRAPGERGIVQLVRQDGGGALLGFEVVRNEYQGDSVHHTGIRFGSAPPRIPADRFTNADGSMKLLHPLLRRMDA